MPTFRVPVSNLYVHHDGQVHTRGRAQQLVQVVQRANDAVHRMNYNPADSVVSFVKTNPQDSDSSGG